MSRDIQEIIRLGAGSDLACAWDALVALLEAVESRAQDGKPVPVPVAVAAVGARQAVNYCLGNRGPAELHADAQVAAYLGRIE